MEISRLIFITLLITCSVVTEHGGDCIQETISKLSDDQCFSELDESELVITTASDETKNVDSFASETSSSTSIDEFVASTTEYDNYVKKEYNVDKVIRSGSRKSDIQTSNNSDEENITPGHTIPLQRSDTEGDIIREEIFTHPLTETSIITSEQYYRTEYPNEMRSDSNFNVNSLVDAIGYESLNYHPNRSEDDSQESQGSGVFEKYQLTSGNDRKSNIAEVSKIEAERLSSSVIVSNVEAIDEPIKDRYTAVSDLGDNRIIDSSMRQSDSKAEEIFKDRSYESDSVVETKYEPNNDGIGINDKFFPKHSSNNKVNGAVLNDDKEYSTTNYERIIKDKMFSGHSSGSEVDNTISNNSTDEAFESGKISSTNGEESEKSNNIMRQQNEEETQSTSEQSEVSELSSRNIEQEMVNDGLKMNQQNQEQDQSQQTSDKPPKASELSFNLQQMMSDGMLGNQQIEQLQNEKVEQGGNEPCVGCDLGILPVTTAAGSKGKIENSPFRQSHAIPEASIQFAEVPPEKDLRVDDLGLAEGSFLFGYLGELLSWLQPNDFPVELMRNALRNQISIIDLITQSLKLEAGFIGCIAIGVSLALAAPIVVLAHTCYRIRRKGDDGDQTPIGCAGNCRRRTLVFFLQIIIFLLLIGTAAMLITNQQVSTAVLQTGDVLKTVLDDLGTFLHNVYHQLHFVVSKHLDQAVQAVNSDLDNVEILLGQPIQAELSRETGLDVALESLRDIAQDVSKVGESVELVQLAAGLLSEGVIMTTDKLSDLRLQVNSFRRQCSPKDRPLCDTLNIAGLEVTLRVDSLRQDDKLNRVRQIGGPELRGAVESARVLFRDIPRQVAVDTKDSREAVRRQLNQEQMNIDENIRSLEILVRNLKGKLTTGQNMLDDIAVDIPELEFWRWMIGLGAAGSLALLWILLQLGISCGCCGSEKSAGPTLLVCVILICLLSTVLWLLTIIVFVVGGHGQAFICRPLYQEPEFPALSQLLDSPGLFPNSHKFISTLAFDNDTIDVPFNKVLRECHENKPVYPVFKLNGVFNIETMTESKKWDKFHDKMRDMKVKLNHLKVLSPTLQNQLNDLLQALSVNLTAHRNYLSSPVTGKDLNSFAAQLESVGNQIKDLATASRMETLASRTRRLIATHIEPLKEKKNNLLYQLTTLEVQLNPLQRQVEQSISHFKTIQFFIDNQGNSIANKKVKEYTHRLMRYIDQYKNNLADRINNNLARCQPLWKLFNTSRLMLCKHVMDPLNGFWFSTVCCLIILLCATPVCLKLVDCYKKKSQAANYNSGSPTENLMSNEQGRDWSSSNGTNDSGGGW